MGNFPRIKIRNFAVVFSLLLTLAACSTTKHSPAVKSGQTAQSFSTEHKQVLAAEYLLFLPAGYGAEPAKKWPLILFLHGAGERGSNIWMVAKHGPPKIAESATNFPFIVVSPQCPEGRIWSNDVLLALLEEIESKHAVDAKRIYLTGLSMGGFGTWSLGLSHPEKFAAIAPICGGGEIITPLLADKRMLASLPVWAFHGAKDPVVPLEESERMVRLMKSYGAKEVKFTTYPEAQHDSWTQTYADPELFAWFLQHTR